MHHSEVLTHIENEFCFADQPGLAIASACMIANDSTC